LPAGTVLRDRYRLTGPLEVGHTATVYGGEELETGRPVTVKVFHEVGRSDRGRIESGRRPASSGVAHEELPGAFVPVRACDLTEEGQLFLVIEVVPGTSLADRLRRTPALAPARALELAMRIGEALEASLNLGLLDLPLAPADIILDDAGRVRLLRSDVLILRRLGLGGPLATADAPERDPRYASPEELAGFPATERSVVYRFGVLLYELMSGAAPFDGTTPGEIRDQQRRPPRRLRSRAPSLPASLDRLVSRMLDPDPLRRPADPTAILNELWDAASRLRAEAPPAPTDVAAPAPAVAPGLPARRSRARSWALAALLVVVIGGALLAWPHLAGGPSGGSPSVAVQPEAVGSPPPAAVIESPPDPPSAAPGASGGPPLPTPIPLPPDSRAPVALGATPAESPSAPTSVGTHSPSVGPAREPTPAPRTPDESASRADGARIESEATTARAIGRAPVQPATALAPPPVPLRPPTPEAPREADPTARPRPPTPERSREADPTAIIDWLVGQGPRVGER
jgi:serine/threonine-protein kinase